MLDNVFVEISFIIFLAVLISGFMKYLKQPMLIGYIITGILAGPYFLNLSTSSEAIHAFSEIGIALLLFMVGVHLNPKIIKEVGKISLITGLGQVLFTTIIGLAIMLALGFSLKVSIYVAIALTFSSTIIIMKLLSDKGDLDTLYGKISMGFLIVQDLVAMILLLIISTSAQGTIGVILSNLLLGVAIIIAFLLFGYYVLPHITKKVAENQEFLLLFTIGWCLAAASVFAVFNFSIEVGALLAGITLSISPYRQKMTSTLKPIRDFFIFMFFIYLGSQMVFESLGMYILPVIILSLFIIIGNVLIVVILMTRLGYKSRTGFLAGLTVAQISEFSLILIALGVSIGDLSTEILSFVTLIGIITISISTYMILYGERLYFKFKPVLDFFQKKDVKEEDKTISSTYDVILFGYGRLGNLIIDSLDKKIKYLIVDIDPNIVKKYSSEGINIVYGDEKDLEFLNTLPIRNSKMIISAVPDLQANKLILQVAKKHEKIAVLSAKNARGALELYSDGADYVIAPHFLAGKQVQKMFKDHKFQKKKYKEDKYNHIKYIKENLDR